MSEESSCQHPITLEVLTELVPPVQTETHIQTNTPLVEVAPENVEPKVPTSVEPTRVSEALADSDWVTTMQEELN
ncbi:hypothetical protein L6452_01965 [Arctium lappa]|uniref:Uncharacterized protein n=1 Tax=Arctium lappa TaxID=4217 RepID=A0ACB9FI56_ARCLA|nr:hypothetical protein L6452_01965 [Arctium lappa]